MLKHSKFNFYTKNKSGELLLYNSYLGVRSLCKLKKQNDIDCFLANEFDKMNTGTLHSLIEKGFIVNSDENESAKAYSQLLNVISPKTLNLITNPTEKCNFKCVYCYESFKHGEMSEATQSKIISFVRNNIHNYTGLNISWFGGEPLLSAPVIMSLSDKLIQICKFNKRSYSSSITTNGYLLDFAMFQDLLKRGINSFQITIDGPKEIHDKQRILASKNGTYDRIVENLNMIKKYKAKNFNVVLRVNFTEEIFDHFDSFLESVSAFFDNDPRFMLSCYKVGDWGGVFPQGYKENLVQDASQGMRRIYTKILEADHIIPIRFDFLDPGSGLCYAGKKNNFLISSNGSVHKCTLDFEDKNSTVGQLINNRIEISSDYFKYICVPTTCNDYLNCFFSPVSTGDPCPIKGKNERRCSFVKDNLDVVLQIADKNGLVDLI